MVADPARHRGRMSGSDEAKTATRDRAAAPQTVADVEAYKDAVFEQYLSTSYAWSHWTNTPSSVSRSVTAS